jgi:tetratricopeptide (TPR) repeat protein
MTLRYAETLQLISRLPARPPSAVLPSRLDELFDKLQACHERTGATRIEDAIWDVWMYDDHHGAELALERAAADIAARRFDIAETRLAILLRRRPNWAEAWNKRATLYYVLERDDESVAAIHRTLEIEPRHFGAMCGLGEILHAHGEDEAACLVFSRALRIHPHLTEVRETLQSLQSTQLAGRPRH